jgi:threonyl-tRNA synthetase
MGPRSSPNKELEEYLERLERARANDHRRLGPQLGLFTFSEVAPGSAFWFPAGTRVFNELVKLSREMGEPRGYTEVKTPQLYDSSLWKTSGTGTSTARTCSSPSPRTGRWRSSR